MSEEFDDIIRQKFAEKEFIFNEANWEKAEMKMDAAKRFKKILWWSSIFSIGLIAGIFLMWFLISNKHDDNKSISGNNSARTIVNNQHNLSTPALTTNTDHTTSDLSTNSTNKETSSAQNENQVSQTISYTEQDASSAATPEKQTGNNTTNALFATQHTDKKQNAFAVTNKSGQLKNTTADKNKHNTIENESFENKKEDALRSTTKNKKQKNKTGIVNESASARPSKKKAGKLPSSPIPQEE